MSNNLKKVQWSQGKELIKKANKELYDIIQSVNPTENMPLFVAKYPYGMMLGIKNQVFLPDNEGSSYLLDAQIAPKDVYKHLGYGKNSFPLGVIINNYCEWFYGTPSSTINFPYAIQGEGTIFNQQIIFDEDETEENEAISVSSGAKSIFLLPPIGCEKNHEKLQMEYNVSLPAPKEPHEHFNIFQEILLHKKSSHNWHSTVIYFSIEWIEKIRNDPKWLPVKYFFCNRLRKRFSTDIYNSFTNDKFMTSNKANYYKPTPFIVDTAKYLFSIATGEGLGHSPAVDDKKLPLKYLQEAYSDYYNTSFVPTVMVPESIDTEHSAVYYSLNYPSKQIRAFKNTTDPSAFKELKRLRNILQAYHSDFTNTKSENTNQVLYLASKELKFNFYHYKTSNSEIIRHSKDIILDDNRFSFSHTNNTKFAYNSQFFRGCIKLYR